MTVGARSPSALAASPLARGSVRVWCVVGLVLLLSVGAFAVGEVLGTIGDGWTVTGRALLIALVAASPAVLLLFYLDRREPESPALLVIAFLWGAVVSTGVAIVLNGLFDEAVALWFDESAGLVDTSRLGFELLDPEELLRWLQTSLVAPYVEEAVKGAALLVIVLLARSEFTSMRDGIIYGGLIGVGFAVVEYVVFTVQAFGVTGEVDFAAQLVPRFVLFGVNGHALYTALIGASVGWVRQSNLMPLQQVLVVVGGYLLAVAGHAMSNAFGPITLAHFASILGFDPDRILVTDLWLLDLLTTLAVNAWVYVVLVFVVVASGYWELRVCRLELVDELGTGVTLEEYRLVEGEGLFRMRRLPRMSRRQSAHLVRAQNELAFRRHDVRMAGGDPATDPLTAEGRARIAGLREIVSSARTPNEED